jgi:hypothetical protein
MQLIIPFLFLCLSRLHTNTIGDGAIELFTIVLSEEKQRSVNRGTFYHFFPYYKNKMWYIFVFFLVFHYLDMISSSINSIPVIHNVSLRMLDYNSTVINGTCDECLCIMLLNATWISAFNCFQNNQTCELFPNPLKTSSLLLMNSSASSIYFISLPVNDIASAVASSMQSTTSFTGKSPLL